MQKLGAPAPGEYAQSMRRRHGFTLVELLVVIAIVGVLMGVLLPALGRAREQGRLVRGGANLSQLGAALTMFRTDHDDHLPQVRLEVAPGVESNIGALFGGRKGLLPVFGINEWGADRRPLNAYIDDGDWAEDDDVPVFEDPADQGTDDPFLQFFPQIDPSSSMYELVGASYNLNDHAPDDDPNLDKFPTLIPPEGGRMPPVVWPSRTWLIGDHPIYNYDDGGDRGQRWRFDRVLANLLFLDGHVKLAVEVAEGTAHTTDEYTFLPTPDWIERFQNP